jgi:hypothetical protein
MRGRGKRNSGVQRVANQVSLLKRELAGHSNPMRRTVAAPPVNLRPWNTLVVNHVMTDAGVEYSFSPGEIVDYLITQLGLSSQDKSRINIKVKRVDLFAAPTGSTADRPSVSLVLSSNIASLGDPATPGNAQVFYSILKTIRDNGNLSEVAKASYSYPKAMADMPMNALSAFTLVSASSNVANASIRFHVSWNTTDSATPI